MGTFAGIAVQIHLTFFVLLVWVALSAYLPERSIGAAAASLVFLLLVFASVVLHELGHALVARRFGIPTRDITLLPIGGVARLEKMPEEPRQELAVAIAGPIVSLLLAVIAGGLASTLGRLQLPAHPEMPGLTLLGQLAVVNASIAAFNLLPAFPMDGGRVLRAVLAMRMDPTRATRIAARIGQALALALGLVGLFVSPLLAFIALFVWVGASHENQLAQLEAALEGIPVAQAMNREIHVLAPSQPLTDAVDLVLRGSQQDFPVVAANRVVGVLGHDALLTALATGGTSTRVQDVMTTEFATVHPRDMLTMAHRKLGECGCRSLPVVDDVGRPIGMVGLGSIGELVLVRQALREHEHRAA